MSFSGTILITLNLCIDNAFLISYSLSFLAVALLPAAGLFMLRLGCSGPHTAGARGLSGQNQSNLPGHWLHGQAVLVGRVFPHLQLEHFALSSFYSSHLPPCIQCRAQLCLLCTLLPVLELLLGAPRTQILAAP